MAHAIYYVMRGGDKWIIRFDDRDYGHNSLTAALQAAIAAARTSTEHGHDVQVLVQRPDTSWVVTWTSEDDFWTATAALRGEREGEPEAPAQPGGSAFSERAGSRTAPVPHGPQQA